MDLYLVFKFLHVVCAALWLGGGFALVLLGHLANRARDEAGFVAILRLVTILAPRLFVPGSALVLVFGLAMVWTGSLAWEAWIVLGLAGIAVTIGLGSGVLGPIAGKVVAAAERQGGLGEAAAHGRRLLAVAKIDYAIQFAIVWMMVLKPSWSDVWMLVVPAVAVAAVAATVIATPAERRVPV